MYILLISYLFAKFHNDVKFLNENISIIFSGFIQLCHPERNL
jgi:hypothetical protein